VNVQPRQHDCTWHAHCDELEVNSFAGESTPSRVFPTEGGRTGRFFLRQVADDGTENCDYLIACDMDNNPVPGYRFTSYEQGYGDMLARADWDTVRIIPWVDKTAMIMCDLLDVTTGELIEVAPRTILQRQVEAAEALGFLPMVAREIEFYLFKDTYDEAHAKGYRDLQPHSPWLEDYHVLQTTKDEYILGQIRRGLEAAGVPVGSARARPARASTRSTSTTRRPSRWPIATASTRRRRRRSPTSTAGR
jgi:hypothetical protein